ncbi:MAG TPA: putative cytokinetic ring protein SteA [Solirubrobacterales bacterium]
MATRPSSRERSRPRRRLFRARRQREAEAGAAVHGIARLGKRTKDLVKRLRPGDIAIIDHADLDPMAAEDLAASGVRAVVNVAESTTGRYPNAGPLVLVEAGVRLVDVDDADLFEELDDGAPIVVDGAEIRSNGDLVARGEALDEEMLRARLAEQQESVDAAIADFARNTVHHIEREPELLSGRLEFPETRTEFRDRHVLIVVRGPTYRRDLRTLRAYIRDTKPLLVGVDGGADAILEAGLKPHVILGDMDSASDAALSSGAELIVHAYPDGRAPGRERLEALGLDSVVIPAAGTSQDIAMLLAYERGAALIVSVGAHFNLEEFLGKNRAGMSSTFLTRLRIGETLVDAKGVSRLYRPSVAGPHMVLFALAAALLIAVVIVSVPALDNLAELLWLKIRVLFGL